MIIDTSDLEKENALLKKELEKWQKKANGKKKRLKGFLLFAAQIFAGKSLKTSIYNSIKEFNEKRRVSMETSSALAASLIKRLTRIGVIALLIAILPTAIMIYQNQLLKIQNKKIQEQTYLAEASRRSSQMFIMGDVLSDINSEMEKNSSSILSPALVGRVVSLSRAMKPYRYLINDKIIDQAISPERGQLLISLCKSNIAPSFFVDQILQESDFTRSELMDANLKGAVLRDINLNHANLSDSDFANVDLKRALLQYANVSNVDFTDADLRDADFKNANLTGSILNYSKLNGVNFSGAIIDSLKVDRHDWLVYIKDKLKLDGAADLYERYRMDSAYYYKNAKEKKTNYSKALNLLFW